jgi:phosphatidylglycerol:prolipoprotein diacylglycerol transferase
MHPILFNVTDTFFIGTYGPLIVLGLLAGLALGWWIGRPRGYAIEYFLDFVFLAVLAGFGGGRLLYILTDLKGFAADPMAYILSRTGFVFLGGLIGAAAAMVWYVRARRLPVWATADVVLPTLALGHAFGRIGCHFAGCCYGGVCTAPVAIQVPRVVLKDNTYWPNAYLDHLQRGEVLPSSPVSLPVWPVQLMEAGGLFVLSAVLVWLLSRRMRTGMVAGAYLLGYGAMRFGLEFLRGDAARGFLWEGGLSTSQAISAVMIVAGVVVLATGRMRPTWDEVKVPPYPTEKDKGKGRPRA